MYARYGEHGLFEALFELAAGGGEKGSRVRLWSAIVLVLAFVLAAVGGYLWIKGSPTTTLPAAAIEDGQRPNLQRWSVRGRHLPNKYQETGRLADSDAVVFADRGRTWRCAPLLSDRADAGKHPGVYYAAPERAYERSRADGRFVGELYSPTGNFYGTVRSEAVGCDMSSEALVVIDDGTLRGFWETGRSLVVIAAVLGGIALIAFLIALRKGRQVPPTALGSAP
jgi:hypothetical protein